MQPTLSPQDFVAKWRHATLKESSAAQEHFIDLCRLIGRPTPAEADPTGETFTFEAGATKQRGGQGWADVWKKGYFQAGLRHRAGRLVATRWPRASPGGVLRARGLPRSANAGTGDPGGRRPVCVPG